jgi:hypothetical protein
LSASTRQPLLGSGLITQSEKCNASVSKYPHVSAAQFLFAPCSVESLAPSSSCVAGKRVESVLHFLEQSRAYARASAYLSHTCVCLCIQLTVNMCMVVFLVCSVLQALLASIQRQRVIPQPLISPTIDRNERYDALPDLFKREY